MRPESWAQEEMQQVTTSSQTFTNYKYQFNINVDLIFTVRCTMCMIARYCVRPSVYKLGYFENNYMIN